MNKRFIRALLVIAAGVVAAASVPGCVSDRPARNGVFNENQYIRKDFLIRSGDGKSVDSGWFAKATIINTSQPNPLGYWLFPGLESATAFGSASFVRFIVTQDKLQMVDVREFGVQDSASASTPTVLDSWPITNVDLKYRVNLDGEQTNFYEENQELDWKVRQWVKINLAKNDMSDFQAFGPSVTEVVNKCTDVANAAATLIPDSFKQDKKNDYMEWMVNVTVPVRFDDQDCLQLYAAAGYGDQLDNAALFGRTTMSFDIKYSFVRATPADKITYKPLELAEKDPIRHKYGPITYLAVDRDTDSQLVAARELVMRYDPTKPITWYFEDGFPDSFKKFFLDAGGIKDQTNAVLEKSGAAARVDFKNFDDGGVKRHYGDVRYSFLRWVSSLDSGSPFLGVTQFQADPRTGETISASINIANYAANDFLVHRIDEYLATIGATNGIDSSGEWPDGPAGCKDGDTMPIDPTVDAAQHNGESSLYSKMQEYLQKPVATYGNLGPQDFIQQQDDDFLHAYFALIPYQLFADPEANYYVTPEGGAGTYGPESAKFWQRLKAERQFLDLAASIDKGQSPYDGSGPDGVKNAATFLNNLKSLTTAHRDYKVAENYSRSRAMKFDLPGIVTFEGLMAGAARACVNGTWETKAQWSQRMIDRFWSITLWHEFGHALGLEHNFMASVDKPNYPVVTDGAGNKHYGLYASSVMDYNERAADVVWTPGWGPYDKAAIAWIYANTAPQGANSDSISGQKSATEPWNDPFGFKDDGSEIQYLRCDEHHLRYTPLCRQFDFGSTPSEIIANAIDSYEWRYKFRNFRQYRKFWNEAAYAESPANLIIEMRRFLSMWAFDWSTGELADSLRRIGIKNPDPKGSDLEYFGQLTDKFNAEMSSANQMVGAFHKAIIQQSAGERPYKTIYDKFYGDVTQQGIILDKLFAMQGWVGLWPTDNYDPNQAGAWISSYTTVGDQSYDYISRDSVQSMIGGQYDVFPYFVPLAVVQFAQDTHDPAYSGAPEVRDWIGGHVFTRLDDFLAFFRDMAVQNNFGDPTPGSDCTSFDTCKYDPRPLSDTHNEFIAPDKRQWIWAYIPDRNTWTAVQKDRNTASYIILRNYNDYFVYQLDDGAFPGGVYGAELPMKYFLDSFDYFN